MKAVDTNVLARYILGDDAEQARRAAVVLAAPCFVSDTVLLETAWLLSSRHKVGRAVLAATLSDLLRLPSLTVDEPDLLAWAIERFAAGADLADMIHLVSSRSADCFVSFEVDLVKDAGSDAPLPIQQPA